MRIGSGAGMRRKDITRVEIDPTQLTRETTHLLMQLLYKFPADYLLKGEYSLDDMRVYLKYSICYREQKKRDKNSPLKNDRILGERYEVLDEDNEEKIVAIKKIFSEWEYGDRTIVKSKGTLIFNVIDETLYFKDRETGLPSEKQRTALIDIQDPRIHEDLIQNRYRLTERAGHLHAKKPYQIRYHETKYGRETRKSVFFSRYIKGPTLKDFLLANKNLSVSEAIDLTKALFEAYRAQVTDRKLYHNDIHSDNIIVESGPPNFKLTIIDYEMSKTFEDLNAPKAKNKDILTFSFVLEEIWLRHEKALSDSRETYSEEFSQFITVVKEIFKSATHSSLQEFLEEPFLKFADKYESSITNKPNLGGS
jgi:tRNA A-37 threonylcarbamoyl transferase component Bud32